MMQKKIYNKIILVKNKMVRVKIKKIIMIMMMGLIRKIIAKIKREIAAMGIKVIW